MAKGSLFLAPISGKIGNVVAYRLTYSNNKVTQAVRSYVADVSNPKTEPQAVQRLKLAPAVNFYRALSEVLDNAWQSERYGNMSRQYFMSLALKQSAGIPFIPRGEKRFFPGEYRVSQGSLPSVAITGFTKVDGYLYALTTLVSTNFDSGDEWGEFSVGLIEENFGLKDGDKLTFIICGENALGEYAVHYGSVILDTTSITGVQAVFENAGLHMTTSVTDTIDVCASGMNGTTCAAAVIVSRLDTSSSAKWQRSNAVMACSDDYKSLWMSAAAYEAALQSYMSSDSYSSDWYLNVDLGTATRSGGGSSSDTISTVSNYTYQREGVSVTVTVATMASGKKLALRSVTSPSYVAKGPIGGPYSYIIGTAYLADATALSNIQTAVGSTVSGWLAVEAVPVESPE